MVVAEIMVPLTLILYIGFCIAFSIQYDRIMKELEGESE